MCCVYCSFSKHLFRAFHVPRIVLDTREVQVEWREFSGHRGCSNGTQIVEEATVLLGGLGNVALIHILQLVMFQSPS